MRLQVQTRIAPHVANVLMKGRGTRTPNEAVQASLDWLAGLKKKRGEEPGSVRRPVTVLANLLPGMAAWMCWHFRTQDPDEALNLYLAAEAGRIVLAWMASGKTQTYVVPRLTLPGGSRW